MDENCACLPGTTQSCFAGAPSAAGRGPCSRGTQTCEGTGEFGEWSACMGSGAPALEACDAADNDCDGEDNCDYDYGSYIATDTIRL